MPEILILLVPLATFYIVVGLWLRKQDHDALDETAAHAAAVGECAQEAGLW
jgi:hypothetical protein